MTAISPHPTPSLDRSSIWRTTLVLVLPFWLGGSLLLDGLVMPALYASGMMAEPGFASAGYSLFWLFNRLELICAATVLSGVLALRFSRHPLKRPGQLTLVFAGLLFAIALLDTYALTPSMSALGLHLNWLTASEVPPSMNGLHFSYWGLELVKLSVCGMLLWIYNRAAYPISQE